MRCCETKQLCCFVVFCCCGFALCSFAVLRFLGGTLFVLRVFRAGVRISLASRVLIMFIFFSFYIFFAKLTFIVVPVQVCCGFTSWTLLFACLNFCVNFSLLAPTYIYILVAAGTIGLLLLLIFIYCCYCYLDCCFHLSAVADAICCYDWLTVVI